MLAKLPLRWAYKDGKKEAFFSKEFFKVFNIAC